MLILSGVRGDTRRYRALHLYEQFRLCGVPADYIHLTNPNVLAKLARPWDLVILHRVPLVKFLQKSIADLRAKGAVILSDFDDLIFDPTAFQYINLAEFKDPLRQKLYIQTMQQIRAMLEQSDGAIASTGFLAEQIRGVGKPVWVHRNAFSVKMGMLSEQARSARSARAGTQPVVIGYASGTPTHNRDFELVRPALKRVLAKYPQVELHLIGPLDPGDDWGPLSERIQRIKLVPWQSLPGLLATFDINLAPLLTDNPFAQSKSEIKYMEAGMLGVPTAASPTEAFRYAIQPGQNGFLAETEAEWLEALSALIENPALRRQIGENAYQAVQNEYHPAARAMQLAEQVEEIMQTFHRGSFWGGAPVMRAEVEKRVQQATAQADWIPDSFEKETSYFSMGLYALRTAGIGMTLKLLWLYFRRVTAPILPYKKA